MLGARDLRQRPALSILSALDRTLSKMWVLRRILMAMGAVNSMKLLLDKLKYSKSNAEFFDSMNA